MLDIFQRKYAMLTGDDQTVSSGNIRAEDAYQQQEFLRFGYGTYIA